jgi:very-short-patch-repair endonuclease
MRVVEELERCGGVATRAQLVGRCGRQAVDQALRSGAVVALTRGRYALAVADEALKAAHELTGTVSHLSAAIRHGWQVLEVPDRPDVTVPKDRRVPPGPSVRLHWADLTSDDIRDGCTTKERTLCDCLRTLEFVPALAVADSALRSGMLPQTLATLARDARGPGSAQIRLVAQAASPLADNPFESALRGIGASVAGLSLRPQVSIREPEFLGRPDLVDERLRILVEADSFGWHGSRDALKRDTRRYNRFVVHGWLVLRFSWEDVMFHRDQVAETLAAAVAERTERPCGCGRSA